MSDPSPISEIIPDTLKELGEDFYLRYLRNFIIFNWKDIVGEKNAEKIIPLYIAFKTLHVFCKESTWRATVYTYKSNFIKKINDTVKADIIDDIAFSNSINPKIKTASTKTIKRSEDISFKIRSMTLTDDELNDIKASSKDVEDSDLREVLINASISRIKLSKYRRSIGWHKCKSKNCNVFCPPEDLFCELCKRKRTESFESYLINLLHELPWLSYADILNEVKKTIPNLIDECTPENINAIKSRYVQFLCRTIDVDNENDVKMLTMLFKSVAPDKLNDKVIKNALYELRYDLPTKGRLKLVK